MRPYVGREQSRIRVMAHGIGALVALVVLVGGVPLVLIALTQSLPLDLGALAPTAWSRVDDGHLLLLVVLAVAWGAWVLVSTSVLLEIVSAVRRMPTPTLPGLMLPQRVAATLVAAVLVALSSASAAGTVAQPGDGVSGPSPGSPRAAMAHGGPGADAAVPLVRLVTASMAGPEDRALMIEASGAASGPSPAPAIRGAVVQQTARRGAAPTVRVERHDTLWLLAEAYLGAGERYTEIVTLNRGVPQPDGRSLREDGRLYPGWTLTLPDDAVLTVQRAQRLRVAPGDTLWEIAEAQLGDPRRYPDIVQANAGDLQPDGRRLRDPDLILPGWVLEVPDAHVASDRPRTAGPERPPDRPRTAGPDRPLALDRAASAPDQRDALPPVSRGTAASPGAPATADPPPQAPGHSQLDRGGPAQPSALAGGAARSAEVPTAADERATDEERAGGMESGAERLPTVPAPEAPAPTTIDSANGMATLPSGAVLGSVLLAGAAAELVRRRRQYQRYRRPGEQLRPPSAGAHQIEQACRTALGRPEAVLLERALAWLAHTASERSKPLPTVRWVAVGADRVTLRLAAPSSQVLPPFHASDELCWVAESDQLGALTVEQPPAFPALVTLGTIGPETVLLNLAAVGTLTVTGDEPQRERVLRGLVAELAFGPAAGATERTLCLADPGLSSAVEPGAIGVEPDPERVAAALAAATGSRRTTAARGAAEAPPGVQPGEPGVGSLERDPFHIVLSDQPLNHVVVPNPACGLITTAEAVDWSGACLVVESADSAQLLPDLLRVRPQMLSSSSTAELVELMRGAELPELPPTCDADAACAAQPQPIPEAPAPKQAPMRAAAGSRRAVVDVRERPRGPVDPAGASVLRPSRSARAPAHSGSTDAAPRVLVLGAIEVIGAAGRAESTRIGRLAETAAFVLLNPGSRPSELQSALWPGRRSNPQTCRQMISRTRTWLGRTEAGEPYLMPFTHTQGTLRLRPEVGSDWSDFQELARAGLADPADTERLAAALALVRGRPFGAVAARELPWADLHINEMIGAITDVAHCLATRLETAGRQAQAHDAALRGLRTESESEILEAIVARTTP